MHRARSCDSLFPRRYGADVDINHHLTTDTRPSFSRRLTSLVVCPLYISAAYHNLQCFKLLLQAGANPDFNCNGPVNTQEFYRGSPGCVMDAVLRHGCEAAFVSLLVEFGANLNLVKWEPLGPEARSRRKVDPEALQVFREARSECPEPLPSSFNPPARGLHSLIGKASTGPESAEGVAGFQMVIGVLSFRVPSRLPGSL